MCVLVYFSPSTVKLAVLVTQAHAHDSRRTHAHIGAGTGRKGQFPCPCARHQSRPQILPPRSRPAPACLASLGLSHWQPQAPFNVDEQTPWQFLQVCLCIGLAGGLLCPRVRAAQVQPAAGTLPTAAWPCSRARPAALWCAHGLHGATAGAGLAPRVCVGARGGSSLCRPSPAYVRARAQCLLQLLKVHLARSQGFTILHLTGIHDLAPLGPITGIHDLAPAHGGTRSLAGTRGRSEERRRSEHVASCATCGRCLRGEHRYRTEHHATPPNNPLCVRSPWR